MEFNSGLVQELMVIQRTFDERITTKNISDSVMAYFVELFEWVNAYEKPFKNWKASPGKGRDVELDELADVTAFGVSILGQWADELGEGDYEYVIDVMDQHFDDLTDINFDKSINFMAYVALTLHQMFPGGQPVLEPDALAVLVMLPFVVAQRYYTIEELVDAYKAKMRINHARQDGTADEDKGYV